MDAFVDLGVCPLVTCTEPIEIRRLFECVEAARADAIHNGFDHRFRRWPSVVHGPAAALCRLAVDLAAHPAEVRSGAWGTATDGTMLTNRTRPNKLGALKLKLNAASLDLVFDWNAMEALDIGGGLTRHGVSGAAALAVAQGDFRCCGQTCLRVRAAPSHFRASSASH